MPRGPSGRFAYSLTSDILRRASVLALHVILRTLVVESRRAQCTIIHDTLFP